MHFDFIFFTFLFCYFIFKKTQFHYTKHSNFNSSLFYHISNHKNHNFTPIIIYFYFIIFFQNSKKHYLSQIHTKYTFHSHFISFPTNCASRFFFTYNTSSLSYTSSYTTKNPPKKSLKTHFSQKFQTTLSYSPLNLILHTRWPSYSHYKYQTTTQERGPKFWDNKITIFIKKSKIFISPWNFTIFQPKVHKHFQQTKNTQKLKKNQPLDLDFIRILLTFSLPTNKSWEFKD